MSGMLSMLDLTYLGVLPVWERVTVISAPECWGRVQAGQWL